MVKRRRSFKRRTYKKRAFRKRMFKKRNFSNSNVLNAKIIDNKSLFSYYNTGVSYGGISVNWGGTTISTANGYSRVQDNNEFNVNTSRWKFWRIKGIKI